MFEQDLCRCRIEFELETVSPLMIGGAPRALHRAADPAGKQRKAEDYQPDRWCEPGPSTIPVSFHRVDPATGGPLYLIPPSSLRGVLRHEVTRVLETVMEESELADRPEFGIDSLEPPAKELTTADWGPQFGPFLARQVFGSTGRRGQFVVETSPACFDSAPQANYSGQLVPTTGVRLDGVLRFITQNQLDRLTQATTKGLRTFGALEVGTRFSCAVEVRNFSWWGLGVMFLALDGLRTFSATVGAKGAVGMGRVRPTVKAIRLRYHPAVAGVTGLPSEDGWPGIGRLAPHFGLQDHGSGTDAEVALWWNDPDDVVPAALFGAVLAEADGRDAPFATVQAVGLPAALSFDGSDTLRKSTLKRLTNAVTRTTAQAAQGG